MSANKSVLAACLLLTALSATACSGQNPKNSSEPDSKLSTSQPSDTTSATQTTEEPVKPSSGSYQLPPESGFFDYQLGGAYTPKSGTTVLERDSRATPHPGIYNICYVNGFQTQPDEAELWLTQNRELLLKDESGKLVVDPDWPDEYILNPETEKNRKAILKTLAPQIISCAESGFDAVEIDNLDTWARFTESKSGKVSKAGSVELAKSYVKLAHEFGLAIAQKNTAELLEIAKSEIGFDFAITEECFAYSECESYTSVYGKQVLQIEYPDNLKTSFKKLCKSSARADRVILRDRDLATPDSSDYLYQSCNH